MKINNVQKSQEVKICSEKDRERYIKLFEESSTIFYNIVGLNEKIEIEIENKKNNIVLEIHEKIKKELNNLKIKLAELKDSLPKNIKKEFLDEQLKLNIKLHELNYTNSWNYAYTISQEYDKIAFSADSKELFKKLEKIKNNYQESLDQFYIFADISKMDINKKNQILKEILKTQKAVEDQISNLKKTVSSAKIKDSKEKEPEKKSDLPIKKIKKNIQKRKSISVESKKEKTSKINKITKNTDKETVSVDKIPVKNKKNNLTKLDKNSKKTLINKESKNNSSSILEAFHNKKELLIHDSDKDKKPQKKSHLPRIHFQKKKKNVESSELNSCQMNQIISSKDTENITIKTVAIDKIAVEKQKIALPKLDKIPKNLTKNHSFETPKPMSDLLTQQPKKSSPNLLAPLHDNKIGLFVNNSNNKKQLEKKIDYTCHNPIKVQETDFKQIEKEIKNPIVDNELSNPSEKSLFNFFPTSQDCHILKKSIINTESIFVDVMMNIFSKSIERKPNTERLVISNILEKIADFDYSNWRKNKIDKICILYEKADFRLFFEKNVLYVARDRIFWYDNNHKLCVREIKISGEPEKYFESDGITLTKIDRDFKRILVLCGYRKIGNSELHSIYDLYKIANSFCDDSKIQSNIKGKIKEIFDSSKKTFMSRKKYKKYFYETSFSTRQSTTNLQDYLKEVLTDYISEILAIDGQKIPEMNKIICDLLSYFKHRVKNENYIYDISSVKYLDDAIQQIMKICEISPSAGQQALSIRI